MLNTGHKYGTITDTMEIIKAGRKGKHLNTLERYHIQKISKNNLQLNDANIDLSNPIFEALNKIYTGHTKPNYRNTTANTDITTEQITRMQHHTKRTRGQHRPTQPRWARDSSGTRRITKCVSKFQY
jgi:hypothetical protein